MSKYVGNRVIERVSVSLISHYHTCLPTEDEDCLERQELSDHQLWYKIRFGKAFNKLLSLWPSLGLLMVCEPVLVGRTHLVYVTRSVRLSCSCSAKLLNTSTAKRKPTVTIYSKAPHSTSRHLNLRNMTRGTEGRTITLHADDTHLDPQNDDPT
jgi:hypothetical protein